MAPPPTIVVTRSLPHTIPSIASTCLLVVLIAPVLPGNKKSILPNIHLVTPQKVPLKDAGFLTSMDPPDEGLH
jgi:hypothetical protein